MRVFDGALLFELKATHGFPIDFAIDRILAAGIKQIDWVRFIEAARANGWWDFQTYRVLCEALEDSALSTSVRTAILDGCRRYVLEREVA